jgi:galactose mutarotase-like enzyme
MHNLSNNVLSIKVAPRGAELQSIYSKVTGIEYLWQAGPEWPKSSPVLFPIVGELKNNTYQHEGKTYQLNRHGFAREMDFELADQTDNSLTFLLQSNPETLKLYPFTFNFRVKYTLHSNMLEVTFQVQNTGDNTMFASVGAHPAFNIPLVKDTAYDDYLLVFNKAEQADSWPLSGEGLIAEKATPFLENTVSLPLKKELFIKDAIVFKSLQSTSITLVSNKTKHGIKVRFGGFPYMGIWAAKGADFVCIEPWCGIADGVEATGNLADKEGIHSIPSHGIFERSYSIELF